MIKSKLSFLLFVVIVLNGNNLVAQEDENDDYLKIGGAVRFNWISSFYESDHDAASNTATWDTWRLNVDARTAGVDLSFEYRFYPTFGTHFIHHGYVGYGFNDNLYMKLGAFQKPFGITKYASHSWWFQLPYYVGLEDDYDMGLGFDIGLSKSLKLNIAYYRQQEPEGPIFGGDVTFGGSGPGRYSYDITPGTGGYVDDNGNVVQSPATLRELNTFNGQLLYNVSEGVELGASVQVGGIYNGTVEEAEVSTAFAGHVNANFGDFNFKGEFINYTYNAQSDAGQDLDIVQMGAYGFNYPVASQANMYVAGLAYSIPVEIGPVSNIQAYVDYTFMDKSLEELSDVHHLIPGFLISAGSIYTYVDFALGKNQPWLTDNFGVGLGEGRVYSGDPEAPYYTDDPMEAGSPVPVSELDWNMRFNVNMGYYF